ncbi:helix-turn-helix transcriptional regulator [Bacillus thuringiensis]|jgi:putative transcriptional regulator|uniref:Helix-turn-helix transcriptional regulator n=5 Tax=Bacillus cereus group TaxID=86661 RepID=A0A6I7ECY3_BACCE|nr:MULTISPECIES: helix-turn-helix transcriptional regulator [Bacillus]EAO56566.1 Transcriptional regulator, Cro/CI family [Bacillus thuringiensis serovar israelensis ATCC 35646]MED1151966.1 helix-turn-helix transcriptional regulator [Bacillus paranthracis]AFQ29197.1 XRE family transcriptional regulator [Bacillus thuringiensis HD-789]AJH07433.1 helix-turn-helix family protein [Bacillus thuringiensis HD1002]AJI10229.1 helix-turn-helix family protein [Bacillus cereus 03BB108]
MQNKLEEIRKKFNYSQEKLALKLNTTRQTIISIEKGKYSPSLPLAIKIARLFNMKVEDIFLLEEENNE